MFRHFIFDIDGTLIDTEATGVLSLMDTVKELTGREMDYDEGYSWFGIPSSEVGLRMGYEDAALFGEVWERNFILRSDIIRPFDGIDEILHSIKARGRHIGCVTSRNRFEFDKDIHLAKIVHYFDHCVCAEDTELHKPYPDPILKYMSLAEESLGEKVNPSECLYIGDTMHDCLCARNALCSFALADWRNRGAGTMNPDYHYTSPSGILQLL